MKPHFKEINPSVDILVRNSWWKKFSTTGYWRQPYDEATGGSEQDINPNLQEYNSTCVLQKKGADLFSTITFLGSIFYKFCTNGNRNEYSY